MAIAALIRLNLTLGRGGTYEVTLLNPRMPLRELEWKSKDLTWFQVPRALMFSEIYPEIRGSAVRLYLHLLAEMNKTGRNELKHTVAHAVRATKMTPPTIRGAYEHLEKHGFVRTRKGFVEVLHPETGESMPEADDEQKDHAYYIDRVEQRRKTFRLEECTMLENETYFRRSLPGAVFSGSGDWLSTSCIFHDDETPSFNVNFKTGQWRCHACDIGGTHIALEKKLLDCDDNWTVLQSIAAKMGIKLRLRSKYVGQTPTHKHIYIGVDGYPSFFVNRYEDGGARVGRFVGSRTIWNLKGLRRVLYKLPDVRRAGTVLLVEGEKKADILFNLDLRDTDGRPVTVTTPFGGANGWRFEYAEELRRKRVLVLPDSDQPGQRFCQAVEASLQKAGIEFRTVNFSEYGNDVRDFLKDHTAEDLSEFIGSDWVVSAHQYSCRLADEFVI